MNLIQFEKVSHFYNNKAALKDLSFEIEDKKITAIIGKSGSGKSRKRLTASTTRRKPMSKKSWLIRR